MAAATAPAATTFSRVGASGKPGAVHYALIDSLTLKALGRATLGVITATIYTDTVDNPESKAFVTSYRAKYNDYPDLFSDYGFVAARVIEEALKMTDGDASNKDKLAESMVKVTFKAPRGLFRFDPVTHNPIQNVYICKAAELEGGRIGNQVIDVVKEVRDPGSKQY